MVNAAKIIDKELAGVKFIVAKYKSLPLELYGKAVKDSGLDIRIVDGDTYNILSVSDFAIVASGTATLEAAIIGTPFVITYKVGLINYIAYRIVAKTKILGLVNVLAGRVIVPELLQHDATPEKIARESLKILRDGAKRAAIVSELARVKSSLGAPGASMRAARAILPYLQ